MIMLHSKDSKVTDIINVANQLMLKCGDVLNYPGGPLVIVRVLLNGRGRQEKLREGNGEMKAEIKVL